MKNSAKISVVISAYNEEKKIGDCLASVQWADEIIVVDNSSTDKTAEFARQSGAKILRKENSLMLNINKNYGFSKSTGDWILSLDADERVTPALQKEIKEVIENSKKKVENGNGKWKMSAKGRSASGGEIGNSRASGYWIPRKNIIFGKWIQSDMWWPDYQLRLFRKGKGKFPEKHVHEYIDVDGETEKLKEAMIHENYTSVSVYLHKLDSIYTENEAVHMIESGRKILWVDAIRFPVHDFLKTFFLQKGYKDGLHGLVLSILQAFYMEVVFAKVWEKQGFPEYSNRNFLHDVKIEFKKLALELRYWFMTSFINETKNPIKKIIYRFFRKLARYA